MLRILDANLNRIGEGLRLLEAPISANSLRPYVTSYSPKGGRFRRNSSTLARQRKM